MVVQRRGQVRGCKGSCTSTGAHYRSPPPPPSYVVIARVHTRHAHTVTVCNTVFGTGTWVAHSRSTWHPPCCAVAAGVGVARL